MNEPSLRVALPELPILACLIILAHFPAVGQPGQATTPTVRSWDYGALAEVPLKAQSMPNPYADDPTAMAAGKKLYGQHCSECHGADAVGGNRGPSLRVAEMRRATPGAIFFVVTNGVARHGMPVWSKLPEPERWQIVSFLQSLNK